ncbi:MAG: hypothetical protein ACRYFX_16755 [Janthinobacterium lividum]
MNKLFTSLRLPLLAVLASFALTSCFDKKCDPKPSKCGSTSTAATTTASGSK